MTDASTLETLIARLAAETALPVELTAPVIAALHCAAAAPDGSPLVGYGLDSAAHVISDTWPTTTELGRDVLAYVQGQRRATGGS